VVLEDVGAAEALVLGRHQEMNARAARQRRGALVAGPALDVVQDDQRLAPGLEASDHLPRALGDGTARHLQGIGDVAAPDRVEGRRRGVEPEDAARIAIGLREPIHDLERQLRLADPGQALDRHPRRRA
jgi:hypothetical protein